VHGRRQLRLVGTRSTGTEAGNYLIAGPGWNGTLPDDALDILPRSPTASP
jgi:hypothetical protein